MALFGSKKKGRFAFDLPRGWADQTVYHFRGPEENEVEHLLMMTIDRNPQIENIEDYALSRTAALENTFPGMEVMVDKDISIPGGVPAYEYTFGWMPGDELKFIEKYVFAFKDGFAFTFYIRFEKGTHKTVGNQLKDAIEGILPGVYKPLED